MLVDGRLFHIYGDPMRSAKKAAKKTVFRGFHLDYVKDDAEFGFWNPESNEYIVIKAR